MITKNPLLKLKDYDQSIWLDFLSRDLLSSGRLQQLIEDDGLKGVTSNPAIFKKAIVDSNHYDDAIRTLVDAGKSVEEIYQSLVVEDVQWAADLLRSVYNRTEGRDGFVSLEVSPHLAYDLVGTLQEARRLWGAVDRPNIFIKVPATLEGLPAILQLISEGINVNITLLFSLTRYRQVAQAYLAGLTRRQEQGFPIDQVASVASFFLSRIDTLVDSKLEKIIEEGGAKAKLAALHQGEVAISKAKIAYQIYQEYFDNEQFQALAKDGAKPQRLLWASTSTKNPEYSDVKYVEALIGPQTVNTMPLKTLDAYRDHGQPMLHLEKDVAAAHQIISELSDLGVNMEEVTERLEMEGVQKFIEPYDELMAALEKKYQHYQRVAEVTA